jgi:hypothetical protein
MYCTALQGMKKDKPYANTKSKSGMKMVVMILSIFYTNLSTFKLTDFCTRERKEKKRRKEEEKIL